MKGGDVVETLTEDNWTPVEVEPLTPFEEQVKRHWQRFLPKTSKALDRTKNGLANEVRQAVHRFDFQVAVEEARTGRHRLEIEHDLRDQLFPPPESEPAA